MTTASIISQRFPLVKRLFDKKSQDWNLAEMNQEQEDSIKKLLQLSQAHNDYPQDSIKSDDINEQEKFLTHLFVKFRNFKDLVDDEYRKVIKAIEKRTGVKFKLDNSNTSSATKKFKVFDWFDGLIRNQRKGIKESQELETKYGFLRDSLGLNIPFHKGMANEIRAGIALNTIIMGEDQYEAITESPYLNSISKIIRHIEESPAFLQKFLFAHDRGKLDIKTDSTKIEELRASLEERNKSQKNISLDRLGIDYLIKGSAENEYIPLQIKTQQRDLDNFLSKPVRIHLGYERLRGLKTKLNDPIIQNAQSDLIMFKRKIPGYAVEEERLQNITAGLKTTLENAPKIKLKQAFSSKYEDGSISNTNFIAELIKQGFLIPVEALS
jgi:hypothetical protein